MKKVCIIGAGSTMFTRQIMSSLLAYKDLPDFELVLEDLDEVVLEKTFNLVGMMIEQSGHQVTLTRTLNQKEALAGADFVINAIQVGGMKAWQQDMDIPKKYGVDQEVGDTLGPGGIFRALRGIPQILSIARDMEKVCPNALLLNYSNPLAPITWAVSRATSIQCFGLCYGVSYTIGQLAGYLGIGPWIDHPSTGEKWDQLLKAKVPEGIECSYAGINHMAWLLDFKYQGKDMYPAIRQLADNPKVCESDKPRMEMLKTFGFWCTENHWHMTDYVPYFRKNPKMIDYYLPERWNLLSLNKRINKESAAEIDRQIAGEQEIILEPNMLNAPKIIHSVMTNTPVKVNATLANRQQDEVLISNLPSECAVEVPVCFDVNGPNIKPVGSLPVQCAALNQTNINVQALIVEAALSGDLSSASQALALDPVTSAQCTLEQIREMFAELSEAQRPWLTDWYKY